MNDKYKHAAAGAALLTLYGVAISIISFLVGLVI